VGLELGSWLEVDDTCMVRALDDGWLHALGDINHHALPTHQGKYQARIAGAAITALDRCGVGTGSSVGLPGAGASAAPWRG
jgi:dihydrolipoamide dehydrogenase